MADNLNTAEFDSKGRCVRHPAIRLRKKKMLGGWKVIIGHCPECCLDEMRRVRDEIDAEQDGGARKDKKKKKKRSNKERRHKRSDDSISEVESEGAHHTNPVPHSVASGRYSVGSETTGSTAQNSSLDGNTIASEPHMRYHHQQQHLGARDVGYHHRQKPYPQQQQSPPPMQRIMVLSMAFADPQTGQQGTYTGQMNSLNHKPDGKGTMYYSNGGIAEGTWMNGVLVEAEDKALGGAYGGFGESNYPMGEGRGALPPPPPRAHRSKSRHREPHGRAHRDPRGQFNPPGFQPPSGNLDRLDELGGFRPTSQRRGESASVQSYNSRASAGEPGSSSASVQNYGRGSFHSGASAMGRVGDGHREFQRGNNQRQPRPYS